MCVLARARARVLGAGGLGAWVGEWMDVCIYVSKLFVFASLKIEYCLGRRKRAGDSNSVVVLIR